MCRASTQCIHKNKSKKPYNVVNNCLGMTFYYVLLLPADSSAHVLVFISENVSMVVTHIIALELFLLKQFFSTCSCILKFFGVKNKHNGNLYLLASYQMQVCMQFAPHNFGFKVRFALSLDNLNLIGRVGANTML